MSTREVPGAAFVAPSRAHDGSIMPNYPTTITSDAGPHGRGTYVHTCYSPMWCAHAGGIGDGCGGATTFTPTATPATTPATTPTDLLVLACEHYGIGLSDAMFNSCLARVTAGESARTVVGALTMDETGVSL